MVNVTDFKLDLSQPVPSTYLRAYEIRALIYLRQEGAHESRSVWEYVSEKETISRATIINFLNRMTDIGVLSYKEVTGKGGYRRIYKLEVDLPELDWAVLNHVLKLFTVGPDGQVDTEMVEKVGNWARPFS